ncbi:hypothetical protein IE81DRAFT_186467 [Ceraceosorus guamensis]|uniref:Protein FRG1 n=1 Tax=Ceraceosorus guamensis TaxID=1522189 RepID=A0A316VXX2_9BASI|nr:hypothetical protein IE81DRAFT_186467 [Ceraceosorus guamensis]PWN41151.1 hypothetical protein IE81DRAFT_186467 [Ceraceosorus guamensis]
MSLRLKFKGDKPVKKHKHTKTEQNTTGSSESKKGKRRAEGELGDDVSDVEEVGGDEQTWVPVQRLTDLNGPAFFYQAFPSTSSSNAIPHVLSYNAPNRRIEVTPLRPENLSFASLAHDAPGLVGANEELEGAEVVTDMSSGLEVTPRSVSQVWVASRVLDTPSSAPVYTLKSCESRFLGVTASGNASAEAEARGPLEMWTLIKSDRGSGAWRLRSAQEALLGLDEVAGGRIAVRGDVREEAEAEESHHDESPGSEWQIRVQWKFRHEARLREASSLPFNLREKAAKRVKAAEGDLDEAKLVHSRQGWGPGRDKTYTSGDARADKRSLAGARDEGRLGEELLNRRMKMKSDRYC